MSEAQPRHDQISPSEAASIAKRSLRCGPYAVLRNVDCETRDGDGAVVLRGRVSSYYFKQLAQEAVRRTDASRRLRIVNELEVVLDLPPAG